MSIEKKPSVLCVHLYDDFSGSSNVCSQVVDVLIGHDMQVRTLVGSHGEQGFIRSRHVAETFPYRLFKNRLLLLASFFWAQICLFWQTARHCARGEANVVYVSTVLPAGAVLAARLLGKPVISHVHETGLGSRMLFRVLAPFMLNLSTRMLCVSNYVADALNVPRDRAEVLPNSLSESNWARASQAARNRSLHAPRDFVVVMACSLLWYKGIDSFLELAQRCHDNPMLAAIGIRFELLLNADEDACTCFLRDTRLPPNMSVVRRPVSVFDHYERSSLVVNLSHAEACIETFGLTLLEAMACQVPVVSPVVGGCLDLFNEDEGGWRIDSRDIDSLEKLIIRLAQNPALRKEMGRLARRSAERFSPAQFSGCISSAFKRQLLRNKQVIKGM